MRKVMSCILACILVLSLTACGGQQTVPPSQAAPASSAAPGAAQPASASPADSKLGGELIVYGWAGNWDLWFKDWAAEFKEEYGVEIKYISGSGQQMGQRIIAEDAAKSDIFISTPGDAFSLSSDGMLADIPWEQIPNAKDVDEKFLFPQSGVWGYDFQAVAINTDFLPLENAPKTLKELADPVWQGKLGLPNVTDDSSVRIPSVMIDAYGEEEAMELIQKIYGNASILFDTPGKMESAVATGQCEVAFISLGNANVAAKQAGGSVQMIVPEEGVYLMLNCISMMKNAPNRENALAFIDFYLSPKRQNNIMNELGISVAVNSTVPVNNEELTSVMGGVDLSTLKSHVPDWPELCKKDAAGETNYRKLIKKLEELIKV